MEYRHGWPIGFVSHSEEMDRVEVPAQNSIQSIRSIMFLTVSATVILLVSYCLIITKCCSNHRQASLLSRFSTLCRWHVTDEDDGTDDSFIAFSPPLRSRGLQGSLICQIPTFQFSNSGRATYRQHPHWCMVCLNEFQEQDMLKLLPDCSHVFHFNCIDVWLQRNCNCPVCRTNVAGMANHLEDSIAAPSSSPQESEIHSGSLTGRGDEDFIVIELWRGDRAISFERQASGSSRRQQSNSERFEKTEIELLDLKKKAQRNASSTAVEEKERDQSPTQIQPLRRSFSLDSVSDRNLYLQVQAALLQSGKGRILCRNQEDDRNSRSIIMLPQGRGSKTAVLPVDSEA